jgi:hypothetical protein
LLNWGFAGYVGALLSTTESMALGTPVRTANTLLTTNEARSLLSTRLRISLEINYWGSNACRASN